MLIIINDDAAYVSWLSRHRQGYVVDSKRKPTKNHLILHRATCSIIKSHKRARLTTGAHIKACSLDATELADWAVEQTGGRLTACAECQPDQEESQTSANHAQHALTRLGREIVSYVLDLAVMYLDGEERHYRPKADAIAAYLDKTPKQIMPALCRLIEEDYLECDPPAKDGTPHSRSIIYPTARSLRTLPAFEAMTRQAVDNELASLRGLEDQAD